MSSSDLKITASSVVEVILVSPGGGGPTLAAEVFRQTNSGLAAAIDDECGRDSVRCDFVNSRDARREAGALAGRKIGNRLSAALQPRAIGLASVAARLEVVLVTVFRSSRSDLHILEGSLEILPRAAITRVRTETFTAKTIDQAVSKAKSAAKFGEKATIVERNKPQPATAKGSGRTKQAAVEDAMSAIPEHSTKIGKAKLLSPGTSHETVVEANSDAELWAKWNEGLPEGAKLGSMKCTRDPKGGFLGLGRQPGCWTVDYYLPFRVSVDYMAPAAAVAKFKRTE